MHPLFLGLYVFGCEFCFRSDSRHLACERLVVGIDADINLLAQRHPAQLRLGYVHSQGYLVQVGQTLVTIGEKGEIPGNAPPPAEDAPQEAIPRAEDPDVTPEESAPSVVGEIKEVGTEIREILAKPRRA